MTLASVIGAWTRDILTGLIPHPAFFEGTPSEREAHLAKKPLRSLPKPLQAYLAHASLEVWTHDMRHAIARLAMQDLRKELRTNAFWTACAESLCESIAEYDAERDFLAELQPFVHTHSARTFSFVQTPVALSAEERAHLRTSIQERDPHTVPLFRVESSLGGGLRLFHQGTLTDHSWTGTATHLLGRLFAH